jgi:hypothetical protein
VYFVGLKWWDIWFTVFVIEFQKRSNLTFAMVVGFVIVIGFPVEGGEERVSVGGGGCGGGVVAGAAVLVEDGWEINRLGGLLVLGKAVANLGVFEILQGLLTHGKDGDSLFRKLQLFILVILDIKAMESNNSINWLHQLYIENKMLHWMGSWHPEVSSICVPILHSVYLW